MTNYSSLWRLLDQRDISQNELIRRGIRPSTMQRLRNNAYVHTTTIDRICGILECTPAELVEFRPERNDEISRIIHSLGAEKDPSL